jgi:hypothetical protein
MLSCQQVARMVSSGELEDAGWLRRLSARMHFLMCRHCRRYDAQIRAVGSMAQRGYGSESDDPEILQRLEGDILSRITGGSSSSADDKTDTPPTEAGTG